jgi:formylglycine-generating enzyme required for sulfatase activity
MRTNENSANVAPQTGSGGRTTQFVSLLSLVLAALFGLSSCAAPSRGAVRDNPKDGLRYVWIPGGSFQAGCSKFDADCSADEKPAHEVILSKGFRIGQTEVTVGAYRRFAEATHRPMPPDATFGDQQLDAGWADVRMPIVNVDWYESKAYCEWIGGKLPTEAQWEYAARGGTTASTYGTLLQIAWFADNAGAQGLDTTKLMKEDEPGFLLQLSRNRNSFHEVGLKAQNDYALYDMLGNVWEWTADWYGGNYYNGSERFDPSGPPNGDARVLRGGSWTNIPNAIRVSVRGRRTPTTRSIDTGFRCTW